MKNELRLRASKRNTINAVIAFGGERCCLGTQSIIQKCFDDRLCSGISERPKHFRCCGTRSVRCYSKVIPSHSAKSIRKMCFHLPLTLLKFGVSITRFSCNTSKCASKQGDGNSATDTSAQGPSVTFHKQTTQFTSTQEH